MHFTETELNMFFGMFIVGVLIGITAIGCVIKTIRDKIKDRKNETK